MQEEPSKLRKLVKNALWLVFYIAIFIAASTWQQRNMLDKNQQVPIDDLRLLDIEGNLFQYSLNTSQNDTFIYFFAPWCSVCHASIDNIEAIKAAELEGLSILIIALDWQTVDEVKGFMSEHELSVPVLLGTREIQQAFKIQGFPSYYLIAKEGIISTKGIGYTTELGMRAAIAIYQTGN